MALTTAFEKDALLSQLARTREDISRLRRLVEGNNNPVATTTTSTKKARTTDDVVTQLLEQNTKQFKQTGDVDEGGGGGTTTWALPLPVPLELESVERMRDLVTTCERLYGGIKVRSFTTNGNQCSLTLMDALGDLVWLEVTFSMSMAEGVGRHITLIECPGVVPVELQPLVHHSQRKKCFRTLVIGFGEYVRFCRKRQAEFQRLLRIAPPDTCTLQEGSELAGTSMRLSDPAFQREVTLVWIAVFDPVQPHDSLNEFLREHVYLTDFEVDVGAEEDQLKRLADDSIDTLVRLAGGVCEAALVLIRRMSEKVT